MCKTGDSPPDSPRPTPAARERLLGDHLLNGVSPRQDWASRWKKPQAEAEVLAYIRKHVTTPGTVPLAGNSIATDRTFIRAYMPRLDEALHYRMIDVSTIKELARRWHPRAYYNQPDKGMAHRALQDIIESIRELDFYRRSVFRTDEGPSSEEAAEAKATTTADYQAFL